MSNVPDFQSLMRPLLEIHVDQKEHINRELVDQLGKYFRLTDEDLREMLPSGRAKLFDNRVGWAKTYLTKFGLIEAPRRAVSMITPLGLDVLKNHVGDLSVSTLASLASGQAIPNKKSKSVDVLTNDGTSNELLSPIEAIELAHQKIKKEIEQTLLTRIAQNPPEFMERLVVDLIVRMGYGGNIKDAGEAIGRSGDEGIDGIIKEDPLGLDTIYLQAKRYEGVIGRPEIQKFAGALQGQRAKKGIFITTSSYTKEARDYVSKIDTKIILIDGATLAQLMYEHGVGVSSQTVYEIKRLDVDYFDEV